MSERDREVCQPPEAEPSVPGPTRLQRKLSEGGSGGRWYNPPGSFPDFPSCLTTHRQQSPLRPSKLPCGLVHDGWGTHVAVDSCPEMSEPTHYP